MAVDRVMHGEVRQRFCRCRPPGHHATRDKAMGFCIFNNVAVAAAHALAAHGLAKVAIVDFDVHHGNGTEDIFKDDPASCCVPPFQHPFYPFSGAGVVQ
jgi:acetoin utilization deacetylase AcuC-like enzyme